MKSNARFRISRAFVGFCLVVLSGPAFAVGLGKLTVNSALDEPFSGRIELLSVAPEEFDSIRADLASRSEFARAGIERPVVLTTLEFAIEGTADAPYVQIVSERPVSDPFLHFLVALDWSGGKIIREYTALLDPPLYVSERSEPRVEPPAVAPASEPAMEAPAETVSDRPMLGTSYGPVKRGESLSAITDQLGLSGEVNIYQRLYAVMQANPEAFIQGNMNLLREGAVLSIPDEAVFAAVSNVAARELYNQQHSDWLAFRSQMAESAPPVDSEKDSEGEESAAMAGAAPAESAPTGGGESAPGGEGEDLLRIVQPSETDTMSDSAVAGTPGAEGGAAAGEEVAQLRDQLALVEESLFSKELENRELRERIQALEEQVAETQRLLAVNSESLALAEQQAADSAEMSASTDTVGQTAGTDEGSAAEDEGATDTQAADAGDEASAPVRTRTTQRGLLDTYMPMLEDPLIQRGLMGVGGFIILILVIVWLRRRRSGSEEEDFYEETAEVAPAAQASDTASPTEMVESIGSIGPQSFMTEGGAPAEAMHADEVDPIAEAEVYLAYGRDQQAADVLQEAIRRSPQRHELKLKLLEIYHQRKDVRTFETVAEELQQALDPNSAEWLSIVEMGRRLNPDNPMFGGGAEPQTEVASLEDDGLTMANEPLSMAAEAPASSAEETPEAPVEPEATAEAEPPAAQGIDMSESEPLPSVTLPSDSDGGKAATGGLDFGDEVADATGDDQSSLDSIEFKPAGKVEPDTPAPEEEQEKPPANVMEFDMEDFAAADSQGGEAATEAPPAASGGEAADSGESFAETEAGTKLDLARAYMEMGDTEAARGLLTEVTAEGSESQKKEAEDLVRQLGS